MKKKDEKKEKKLKDKRERKRMKRRDKSYQPTFFNESTSSTLQRANVQIDKRVIANFEFDLDQFLNRENGSSKAIPPEGPLKIPKNFRLEEEPDDVFLHLRQLRQKIMEIKGDEIIVDFKNCLTVDFASLFILRVIVVEYRKKLEKLNRRLKTISARPIIRIRESKSNEVNMKLLANHIISNATVRESDLVPISAMKFHVGSKQQSKYSENRKGSVATKIRDYINECLIECQTSLTPLAKSELDGIISETLNNAEDHSPFDTWYSFGNFLMNMDTSDDYTGEVNLAFMNFGYSIYKGIEETKELNKSQYEEMNKLYEKVKKKDRRNRFTRENLFTLYALQEGVSRLKHEDQSRGTGTMTFIRSFQVMGDHNTVKKEKAHRLLIFSGRTMLRCDNEYKPFKHNNQFFISLNKKNNLSELPEKSHLKTISTNFPGTLLIVKMALSKNHLHKKISDES